MELVHGITFHSSKGFRYLISGGCLPYDFSTDLYIAELFNIYSHHIPVGSAFYFVYPKETPQGNMQVFGKGESVRSMEQDRPIMFPFLQYFACPLSDSIKLNLDFEAFFKEHGVSYAEIFQKSQMMSSLAIHSLTIKPSETIGEISPYFELHESIGLGETKIKKYVPTVEEGLKLLNNLMLSPPVLRWSYSAILTPLDGRYPESIVIVYGQQPKPQPNILPTNFILPLHSADQETLLKQFLKYIASMKCLDIKTANINLLDTQKLTDLDEILKKFLVEYPIAKAGLTKNVEPLFSKLRVAFQELGRKVNPTTLDLVGLDRALNDYEGFLGKSWNDSTLSERCYLPDEDLYSSLANYPSDVLGRLLDNVDGDKIVNARLRNAIEKKIQSYRREKRGKHGN
jgi:hypothetical protein